MDCCSEMRTFARVSLVGVMAGFAVSIAVNLYLANMALSFYRDMAWLRLDPCNAGAFDGQEGTQEDDHARVVLIGDSRVALWRPLPTASGWQILNRGIGSETAAQTKLRVAEDVIAVRPALAVLQAGINDLKAIGIFPKDRNRIVNSCVENIRAMVERLEENGTATLVMTIVPPGKPSLLRRVVWSDDIYDAVAEVNAAIREMERDGVTVLDCDLFMTEGGRIKPEYGADTLHFSRRGYEELNRHLEPLIAELIEKRK